MTTELIWVLHSLFILPGLAAWPLSLPAQPTPARGRAFPRDLWGGSGLGTTPRDEAAPHPGHFEEQLYLNTRFPKQEKGQSQV